MMMAIMWYKRKPNILYKTMKIPIFINIREKEKNKSKLELGR